MTENWHDYQERAAAFFLGLGLNAATNVKIEGTRTSHLIDIVVRSQHVGFDILWIVECKQWATPVSKLHVLALRQIVTDVGADRGIILCESGFQSGAFEASTLTNVTATSIAEFEETARDQITSMRLRDLYDRIEICEKRYWEISKYDRIEHGLRPEPSMSGYSATRNMRLASEVLLKAFRNVYPIENELLVAHANLTPTHLQSACDVVNIVEPIVIELEKRLDSYDKNSLPRM